MFFKSRNKKKYYKSFKKIGENAQVAMNGKFVHRDRVEIGNYCYIGYQPYIYADGGLKIGDGTIIGPKVTILTSNHNYDSPSLIPYDEKTYLKGVNIGRGCWLGANVQVCPGVNIGDGVVVAMGAVVTKDMPDFSIVGGNPAKIIKLRNEEVSRQLITDENYYLKAKKLGLNNIYIDEIF